MRRPALTAVLVAPFCILLARGAEGHLRPSGASSLVRMMAAADGMLQVRSLGSTRDARGSVAGAAAQTEFTVVGRIAGDTPSGNFVLAATSPALRYAAAQTAVVLVAREGDGEAQARWVSVQPAGTAILLPVGEEGRASRELLGELWRAVHPDAGEPDAAAAARALTRALGLPVPKLRALAYLDLFALAGDPEHLPGDVVTALEGYGSAPGDDPALAPRVRELAHGIRGRQQAALVAGRSGQDRP